MKGTGNVPPYLSSALTVMMIPCNRPKRVPDGGGRQVRLFIVIDLQAGAEANHCNPFGGAEGGGLKCRS